MAQLHPGHLGKHSGASGPGPEASPQQSQRMAHVPPGPLGVLPEPGLLMGSLFLNHQIFHSHFKELPEKKSKQIFRDDYLSTVLEEAPRQRAETTGLAQGSGPGRGQKRSDQLPEGLLVSAHSVPEPLHQPVEPKSGSSLLFFSVCILPSIADFQTKLPFQGPGGAPGPLDPSL